MNVIDFCKIKCLKSSNLFITSIIPFICSLRNLKSEDFSFLDVDSERPLVAIGNQVRKEKAGPFQQLQQALWGVVAIWYCVFLLDFPAVLVQHEMLLQVFEGEYVDCVGTSVFFTACERREPRDKVFDKYSSTVSVQLSDTTRKRLVLKRVFLNKKNQDSQTTESSSKEDSAQSETQGDKERIVESK